MTGDPFDQLRALCLALPYVHERISHGGPAWFAGTTARNARQFVAVDDHHHGVDHLGFWCPAPPGAQEVMVERDSTRFFRPPYVGHRGWVGVRFSGPGLSGRVDWDEIDEIVRDAYRQVATAKLIAALDATEAG